MHQPHADGAAGLSLIMGPCTACSAVVVFELQIPSDSDVTDPQFYKDKAERLGKVRGCGFEAHMACQGTVLFRFCGTLLTVMCCAASRL